MWFKNIRAYRLTSPFTLTPEQLGEQLGQRSFQPCAKSQALSLGWVAPVGGETEFGAVLAPVGGPVARVEAVAQGRRIGAGQ